MWCKWVVVLWLAMAGVGDGQQVVVDTLDGPRAGSLVELNAEFMLLDENAEGVIEIDMGRVFSLRATHPLGASGSTSGSGSVELVGGSRFDYFSKEFVRGRWLFSLESPEGPQLDVGQSSIRSWRTAGETTPEELSQWEAIAAASGLEDRLVVRDSTGTLDYVQGAIESLGAGGVRFALGQDVIPVGWERVYGLVFARPPREARSSGVLHTRSGAVLLADQIDFERGRFRIRSDDGAMAGLPWDRFDRLDLSAGKLTHLADLEVISEEWTPAREWSPLPGEPRRDQAFDGGPLRLRFPDPRVAGVWRLRAFDRGLALRSHSVLVLRLPGGAAKLRGWLGVDPAVAQTAAVEVRLLADHRVLAELVLDGFAPPVRLEKVIGPSLHGARELKIVVDYGENSDTGDIVHFADACVTL